jgi:tetratricopeptide (TPR) repeat protein
MPRSFRCFVLTLGVLTALVVLGSARLSWSGEEPGPPTAPAAKTEAPKEIKEAVEAFQKRDFDGCEKKLQEACKQNPDLPPAPVLMATFFAQANQGGAMQGYLERAVLKSPDDPEAYVIMGNILLQERRVTSASLLFAKAEELLKTFKVAKRKDALLPQVVSGTAAVAEAREKWDVAQKQLENLLTLIPAPKAGASDQEKQGVASAKAQALMRLARATFQQADAAAALKHLKAAYEADKQNVLTPEAALGQFYEQYGDHENAKKWMTNALQKAPEDIRTQLVVGQWALETNQIDLAQKLSDKALQLAGTDSTGNRMLLAQVFRGVVALFKEDYTTAEKHFQEAHMMSPGNFAAKNNLALALCEQKEEGNQKPKLRKAFEYANDNFQQYPKNAEAASTLGWVLYKMGDLPKAERALTMAASAGQMSADTAFYLAQVFYSGTPPRMEEAKNLLEAATKGERPFSKKRVALELLAKVTKELADKPPAKKDSK